MTQKNAQSEKQGNQKVKICISKETFVNVFICFPVSPVHCRKSDTSIHSQRQGWSPLQSNNFERFQNPTNHCYNCGELGHWKHSCPKNNIIKIEVNPNRMDKTEADIKDKYFDLFGWFCSDQVLEGNYFDEKESSVKSNCSANPKVSKGQT